MQDKHESKEEMVERLTQQFRELLEKKLPEEPGALEEIERVTEEIGTEIKREIENECLGWHGSDYIGSQTTCNCGASYVPLDVTLGLDSGCTSVGVRTKVGRLAAILGLMLLPAHCLHADAVKWDYISRPVTITENLPALNLLNGLQASSAFDGYGTEGASRCWMQKSLPTEQSPALCEIDYGAPVAVSAFVHYFYVPDGRDLRYTWPAPSAFKRVRISSKTEGGDWAEVTTLMEMSPTYPQILPVNASKSARYWRIEVLDLCMGAEQLLSYEIETYTGGIPTIQTNEPSCHGFRADFTDRVLYHNPVDKVDGTIDLLRDAQTLQVAFGSKGKAARGALQLLLGGKPAMFAPVGSRKWKVSGEDGGIVISSTQTTMGLLLELSYLAKPSNPVKHKRAAIRLAVPGANLYYMPAYVWSRKPVEQMIASALTQTRIAALGIGGGMLCLAPGADRGLLGFASGAIGNDLLLGPDPTPVLLSFVAGDWYTTYKFAVSDVYNFSEQPQSVPVSEMQYGISRYMMSDEVWEPKLGTVKSWPARDPFNTMFGDMCYFAMYGAPYSIPAYWARYAMNGDKLALERLRSIARWLCESGVRMQDGPARGAFFNMQASAKGKELKLDQQGCTQARTPYLTSHATGAALWSLLYYRKVTGDDVAGVNNAIHEAVEWLLKTQNGDGSWPYAHDVNAKPVDGAPSAGCSWNIWALWRYGKETGDIRCFEVARKATAWYKAYFVKDHNYHGYWEDGGPNTREGYDAAIAAVAFGDMGEKELAVQTARDAVQWVFTRRLECRDPDNSAGLVSEQTSWPPASYCNPMMGLAAYTAWQISGDEFFRPFAMIPKAIGWWYQPDTGAMVWIIDAGLMAPLVGNLLETWWCDWCIAQPGSLTLRWLVREVNRRCGDNARVDEEMLAGNLLGRQVRAWAPPGGFHPTLPTHGQVNWLGFKSDDSLMLVFVNSGASGDVSCSIRPRDVLGASLTPQAIHRIVGARVRSSKWDGKQPVRIDKDGTVILEWSVRK